MSIVAVVIAAPSASLRVAAMNDHAEPVSKPKLTLKNLL